MNFIKTNLWEIERSNILRYLGAVLSFLHMIQYLFWLKSASPLVKSGQPLLCWDFFSNCQTVHLLPASGLSFFFNLYFFMALIGLFAFIFQRFPSIGWGSLFVTNILFLLFYLQDASLSSDMSSFLFFVNLGYLFIPNKRPILRWGLLIMYFFVGFRELSPEWLSGSFLHLKWATSYKTLEWVAALGIVVQWTLPVLLLSPRGDRFAIGSLGLLLFHALQFYLWRDFSSIAHITLILFFVADFFVARQIERESMYQSYAHPEPSRVWCSTALLIYFLIQTPWVKAGQTTDFLKISGPRIMGDCRHIQVAYFKNETRQVQDIGDQDIAQTYRCHPIVAFHSIRKYCNNLKTDPNFISLSSHFLTKKLSDLQFKTIFTNDNICADGISFKQIMEGP